MSKTTPLNKDRGVVRVGFDYWQVLSHYPKEMLLIADALIARGVKCYCISAVGKNRVGTIAKAVEQLGIKWDSQTYIHEVVFDDPKQSPELKLAKCKELGITMFFDDRDDVCRLLNKNGIVAMRVTRKDNSTYDLGAEIK